MIVIYTFYIQNIAFMYVDVITMFSAFVSTGFHHVYIDLRRNPELKWIISNTFTYGNESMSLAKVRKAAKVYEV